MSQLLSRVVKVAYNLLSADRVTIFFVDEQREELWCVVSQDAQGEKQRRMSMLSRYVTVRETDVEALSKHNSNTITQHNVHTSSQSRERRAVVCGGVTARGNTSTLLITKATSV